MLIKYMMTTKMVIDKQYQWVVDDDDDIDEYENQDLMFVAVAVVVAVDDDDRTLETMNRMSMMEERMHLEFVEVLLAMMFVEMMD